MKTLLIWIVIIAAVGAVIGFLGSDSGERKEGALGGALGALWVGGSCLLQLLFAGIAFAVGLWIFSMIFG